MLNSKRSEDLAIDKPEVVEAVQAAHDRYELALAERATDALAQMFWRDKRARRWGLDESIVGHQAIVDWRLAHPPAGGVRRPDRRAITAFGQCLAVIHSEFAHENGGTLRQSQTWVFLDERWVVVAAHLSVIHPDTDGRSGAGWEAVDVGGASLIGGSEPA
jgi:hypothetical protein